MNIRSRRKAKLEVISGNLPSYINVFQNSAISVRGRVQMVEGESPVWNTEKGNLGNYLEDSENVLINLSAQPSVNGTTVTYNVLMDSFSENRGLPFGLELDNSTGVIKGDMERNLISLDEPTPFYDEDRPVWEDENQLTTFDFEEGDEVNIGLLVEPKDNNELGFEIVNGFLPFGSYIDETEKKIKGTLSTIVDNPPVFDERNLTPRWITPFGLLARINEKGEYTFQLNANSRNNAAMRYDIVSGGLPWGLTLSDSGEISGISGEILRPILPNIINKNAPTIENPTRLGSFEIEDEVNIDLNINLHSSRTIKTLYVKYTNKDSQITGFPFGIHMNSQGHIRGEITDLNEPGIYRFVVYVEDNTGAFSESIHELKIVES